VFVLSDILTGSTQDLLVYLFQAFFLVKRFILIYFQKCGKRKKRA